MTSPSASDRVYRIVHRGTEHGPFSLEELWGRSLTAEMMVWRPGMPAWMPIGQLSELEPLIRRAANPASLREGRRPPPTKAPPSIPDVPPPFFPEGDPTPPISPPPSGLAKTIGILNIVFGSIGLLSVPFALIGLLAQSANSSGVNALLNTPFLIGYQIVAMVLGGILSILLLIAGIGLCKRQRWGRTLSLVYAWTSVAMGVIGLLVTAVNIWSPLFRVASELDSPDLWMTVWGAIGGGLGAFCFGAIYWIAVLVTMNISTVRNSLQ